MEQGRSLVFVMSFTLLTHYDAGLGAGHVWFIAAVHNAGIAHPGLP